MVRARDWMVVGVLIAVAVYFLIAWLMTPGGADSFDIYMYYYPNVVYAVQRLQAGGSGLLWNPWQNCGQPSFGISSTGAFYPPNLFFLLTDPDSALRLVTVVNFAVAGISAYALGRQLDLGRVGALCMALTFELGTATVDLGTWGPQMGSTFVWMPAALFFCERLLRAPTYPGAVGLGVCLALPLLPGFPQVVFFTYQVIALRVIFELVTRRMQRPGRTLGYVLLGLTIAPLLLAVQLVPGTEMAAQSIRGGSLDVKEVTGGIGFLTLGAYVKEVAARYDLFNPILLVPSVAAAACWLRAETRRTALFYFLAGLVYFLLAFGPATPLYSLYSALPLGTLFREPGRFMWVSSFCFAVLTGVGVDALLSPASTASRWRRWSPVVVTATSLLALYVVVPGHLKTVELVLGGLIVAAALAVAVDARLQAVAAVACTLAVGLGVSLFYSNVLPPALRWHAVRVLPLRQLIDGTRLWAHEAFLKQLATNLTPQDRAFFVYRHMDFSLMPKTASLLSIPVVQDYEPQAARRYAEYFVLMRTGAPLRDLNDFYYPTEYTVAPRFRKRLLDLAAGRYVVAAAPVDNTSQVITPPLYPLAVSDDLGLTVYENQQALRRARFVPTVEVVPDAHALLKRLAFGSDDLSQVALLEEPPPSGFLGAAEGAGAGTAEIVIDTPERVVVRVYAPTRGFLHLADQYDAGWRATVDEAPTPILRADYLFRAVEVPAGVSVVEFRYQPLGLRIGAAISAATLLVLIAVSVVHWRHHRGRPLLAADSRPLRDPEPSRVTDATGAADRLPHWLAPMAAAALGAYAIYRYRDAMVTFFFYDDFWIMRDAARIHLSSAVDLLQLFRPGHMGFVMYRPFTTVAFSYLLQTLVGLDASAQHGILLLVFAANVVLAFAITRRLTQSSLAAAAGALLYTIAPGQAVNAYWLAAFSVTGTAFWLLVLIAAWLLVAPRRRALVCAAVQVIALLCSEHAVSGPVLLAIVAAMQRESPRRALRQIAPSAILVAGYVIAKGYYLVVARPPAAATALVPYALTGHPAIWVQHLGQYFIWCFTPLVLWELSERTALLLGCALLETLAFATWRAARRAGPWDLVAGGGALFVAGVMPVVPLASRFGSAYICVAVLGAAWVVIGTCRLVSRHGSLLALVFALAMLIVGFHTDERAWRREDVFELVVNGSLSAAAWMETARAAAPGQPVELLIPETPVTLMLFQLGEVQTVFPEMPERITLYRGDTPPQPRPGQMVVRKETVLTPPGQFPGAERRWDWLRWLAARRDHGKVLLGAHYEYGIEDR
jgi:hypothetical protein